VLLQDLFNKLLTLPAQYIRNTHHVVTIIVDLGGKYSSARQYQPGWLQAGVLCLCAIAGLGYKALQSVQGGRTEVGHSVLSEINQVLLHGLFNKLVTLPAQAHTTLGILTI